MTVRSFTDLVQCEHPLQLAAMGGAASTVLAVAVADAGGLGMIAGADRWPLGLGDTLRHLATQAAGPVGVNFLVPFLQMTDVELAAARAPVVEFFWGPPDTHLIETVHGGGALAGWQIGSVADARAAEAAGCDYVILQGMEAGGHVAGRRTLQKLLEDGRAVIDIPIVAAGGLGSAATVAAAFAAGADAVRVGTRLLAAHETPAHPDYVDAIIEASAADTVLTTVFGTGWPDARHRVLRSAVEAVETHDDDPVGEIHIDGRAVPVPRAAPVWPDSRFIGHTGATALYAGHSVDGVTTRQSAAEIIAELLEDTPQRPDAEMN